MPAERRSTSASIVGSKPRGDSSIRLDATSLIRSTYRALLTSGRSYAGFTKEDLELAGQLHGARSVLDPMSGYGSVTQAALVNGLDSVCLEVNAPQYYWQVLTHPSNRPQVLALVERLRLAQYRPLTRKRLAIMSSALFPEESLAEIAHLRRHIEKAASESELDNRALLIALLLPFVGRLACFVSSSNPTHVKNHGGICVLSGYHDDFRLYLESLGSLIAQLPDPTGTESSHAIHHGDCRTHVFLRGECDALLTSPPYPNRSDYGTMFLPELEFLAQQDDGESSVDLQLRRVIGTTLVSGLQVTSPRSSCVLTFLERISDMARKKGKRAQYDHAVYYEPYFRNYFCGLEAAWENAATALSPSARGFIIVVDNTHRGVVVPLAEFTVETWQRLGFRSRILHTKETTHVGTLNPRARGLRSLHAKHVIELGGRA